MPDLSLRPARPGDAERLAELHIEGWRSYRGLIPQGYLDDPSRLAASCQRWTSQLARPTDVPGQVQVWVAHSGGEVVGFCSFGPCSDPIAPRSEEFIDLWVDPALRGGGIGTLMMEHVLANTARPLVFWVLRGNDRAAALYRRHGVIDAGLNRRQVMTAGPGWDEFEMVDDLMVLL